MSTSLPLKIKCEQPTGFSQTDREKQIRQMGQMWVELAGWKVNISHHLNTGRFNLISRWQMGPTLQISFGIYVITNIFQSKYLICKEQPESLSHIQCENSLTTPSPDLYQINQHLASQSSQEWMLTGTSDQYLAANLSFKKMRKRLCSSTLVVILLFFFKLTYIQKTHCMSSVHFDMLGYAITSYFRQLDINMCLSPVGEFPGRFS